MFTVDGRAARALSPGAAISIGDDEPADMAESCERLWGAGTTKMVAAGSTITASVHAARERGVLLADVARHGRRIDRIRYYPA